MALRLYLDDCAYSHRLAAQLRNAGHTVVTPAQAGLVGFDDHLHFRYAVEHSLMVVTKNPSDFLNLHEENQPDHPGILLIWQDNNVCGDMTYGDIVNAIQFLEETYAQSETPLAGLVHNLNQWRRQPPGRSAEPSSRPPASPPAPPAELAPPETSKSKSRRRRKKEKDQRG